MAAIYAQQKQLDKARASLIAALKTNPSYATAHENLGDIYARLASQAYDKVLQTDSASTAPPARLAMIRNLTLLPRAEVVARAPTPAPTQVAAAGPAAPAAQLAPPPAPVATSAPKPAAPPVRQASMTVAANERQPAPPTLVPARPEKPETKPEQKPETKPEPKSETKSDADAAARLEVGRAIQAWAAAWSRKDVKTYLNAYAKEFQPPGRQSRGAWEAERTQRVSKPGRIDVDIDNLRVAVDGDTATAYFRQTYSSANLNSTGAKVLVMVKRDGRWQIKQERVGTR
jgi:ketosteroid isomerase-like protein